MKNDLLRKFLFIGILIPLTYSGYAQSKDTKSIQKCFENYKTALINKDGNSAVKCVDQNTLNYYSEMLKQGIYADSSTLASMNILDKMMIFTIRHRIPKELVLKMDVYDFFVYAVENGMVGSDVSGFELKKVSISGYDAKSELQVDGKITPFGFAFHKEEKEWKIDLTSVFTFSLAATENLVESYEMADYEFVFYLLEIITGKKPDASIWQALSKK